MDVARRIRKLRSQKDLSLRKVADTCSISASLLSQIETGRVDPSLNTLRKIAQALVNRPRILFLDEPSIGLDPFSKRQVGEHIRELNEEFKITVLLTTHDMSEADELCDRVAIMNAGKVSIIDTPTRLKESVGGDVITVTLGRGAAGPSAPPIPEELGRVMSFQDGVLKILAQNGEEKIPRITGLLSRLDLSVDSISLAKPTLEDVFVKYAKAPQEASGFVAARSERRNLTRRTR